MSSQNIRNDKLVRIFVSYAHEDAAWQKVLFKRNFDLPSGIKAVWTDNQIQPGTRWDGTITTQLEQATVAILLVSKHFLSSVYIGRKELSIVLKRRTSDALKLLWIPIGNLDSDELGELAEIQSVWSPKKPLSVRPNSLGVTDKVVEEVRYNIMAAIDPVGVPLRRHLGQTYESLTLLAETSTTMVYRSRDRNLDRTVVIKTPTDMQGLDTFVQKVRDAANISDGANFVHMYEAVLAERQSYCVMQYIEGQNLRKWIELDNRRPLDLIIRILSKVTKALVSAHAQGVSYGNLKPSNIILSSRNEPFILPMGRRVRDSRGAKALDELVRRPPDAEEIAYLAPEQFDPNIETVSGDLSDQYMLGLLAFELITGILPPTIGNPESPADSLAQIRSRGSAAFNSVPLVSEARPECPEMMARIIKRMTSKSPRDRYNSLSELLVEVRRQEDVILARARESYARCLDQQAIRGKNFFAEVYNNFFARRKDARDHFRHLGERQYEILGNAVVGLFAFYEQERTREPNEPNVLTQIALKHDRNHEKITMDFYAPFTDSLVDTVCGAASPANEAFDPRCRGNDSARSEIRRAWQEVLRPGVAYMSSKY